MKMSSLVSTMAFLNKTINSLRGNFKIDKNQQEKSYLNRKYGRMSITT